MMKKDLMVRLEVKVIDGSCLQLSIRELFKNILYQPSFYAQLHG
jgi:hypothetical protein